VSALADLRSTCFSARSVLLGPKEVHRQIACRRAWSESATLDAISKYGIDTGIEPSRLDSVTDKRKITLEVSEDLLDRALAASGEGLTQTVRRGLELVAAGHAYDELRSLRGKLRLGIDLERLREDR